jgi:hypothetical protein
LTGFSVFSADNQTTAEKSRLFINYMNSKSYKKAAQLFGHPYGISSKEYKERLNATIDELTVIRRTFGKISGLKPTVMPNYKMQVTGVSLAEPEYVATTLPNKQIVFSGKSARKDKVFINFQYKTLGSKNALLLVLISYL